MSEGAIRLAAKLYETRDGLKLLMGPILFAQRMKEVGILLKDASEQSGLGIMEIASRLASRAQREDENEIAVMYLTAALELLEPSIKEEIGT